MRTLLAFALLIAVTGSAQAERRMFIISANTDGYGVDRCLANGEKCGAAAAAAYCRNNQYSQAASYQKVDKDEITGSIPTSGPGVCPNGKCEQFVAIVCTR